MKNLTILLGLLLGTSTMAFNIQDGLYKSEEGCEIDVFVQDSGVSISYEHSFFDENDNEVYSSGNIHFSSNYETAISGPGLCGEEGLPSADISISGNNLDLKCGGFLKLIDASLYMTASEDGMLESFDLETKIAKFSTIGFGSPQPKKLKELMKCTNFEKVK